ncbi:MAG: hypothetical protein IJ532_02645 [Alphaproteobacteria bacterium]|nr:hypothetical protein [Alphaproteobacteria bacterium]
MTKVEKSKCIKTILLLLSTLLFPLQFFSIVFYFIPSLYICFIVPYLIWKIWFGKDNQKIKKITLIWKLPIVIFLAWTMFETEILLVFLVPHTLLFIWKLVFFIFSLLLFRSIIYVMMIFVWQSDILVPYRKLIYAFILAYCIAGAYLWYSSLNAPDTDDHSVSFYEYMSSQYLL